MEFRTLSTTVGMICFSLGISGCESTIEFGEAAEPKTNDRNEVNEPANIGPNNAYFTYEVITKPSKDSDLLINTDKGSGSPFSDLKETYALILYPNIPSKKTNQEEPINLSQAVAIFQKSKTTGKTDTERKYLSPFITVTETSNYVTRVSYKDVDHQIDYDTLFKSATLGVQLASGSPMIINPVNMDNYEQITKVLDKGLDQWLKTNASSKTTIVKPLLTYDNGKFTTKELSIPIIYKKQGETDQTIGHVHIRPTFLKTVWLSPAKASDLTVIKYEDIKHKKPLSNEIYNGDKSYEALLALKGNGELSVGDIERIGKDIDWTNPSIESIKDANVQLTNICEKTQEILEDAGLHIYDQHLLLAQRLELSPLWKKRITSIPENNIGNATQTKQERLEQEELYVNLSIRKHIDVSENCLNYDILAKQEYPAVSKEAVDNFLEEIDDAEVKPIAYFISNIGDSFNNQDSTNTLKNKDRYTNLLQLHLSLPDNSEVAFHDHRQVRPESWVSAEVDETISSEELMSRFYDMQFYLYGCYLQPKYHNRDRQIEQNLYAVRMLYYTRNSQIGSVMFDYDDSSSNQLQSVTLEPIHENSINLAQVKKANFEASSSCYRGTLSKIEEQLLKQDQTAYATVP